jgi:glycosyltransferase involved in cell wall biosynthesis
MAKSKRDKDYLSKFLEWSEVGWGNLEFSCNGNVGEKLDKMKSRKIVYVIGSASIGGAELQMLQLSKLIKEKGWICEIWFLRIGSGVVASYASDLNIKWRSFNIQKNFKNPFLILSEFTKFISAIRQSKPDIVQAYMSEGIIIALNLFRFISPNTKRVAAIRGFIPNKGKFIETVLKNTLQNSSLVTVNARHLAIETENRFFIRKESIRLIHNGVSSVKTELDLLYNPPNIIIISNFHKYKGHKFLLEALSKVHLSFKCLLIGDGQEKESVKIRINELGLSERVLIQDHVSDPRLFLKLAQIAVHPSETEGLSNAILEEMSWGLPIIAFNVGGNNELISNNVNGFLLNLNDEKAFIEKLSILITDTELRIKMGAASKELAQKFSWNNCLSLQ